MLLKTQLTKKFNTLFNTLNSERKKTAVFGAVKGFKPSTSTLARLYSTSKEHLAFLYCYHFDFIFKFNTMTFNIKND